jgi:hypothetical protein
LPDISKCTGGSLPICQHCYRRTVKSGMRQSFFGVPPEKDGKCDYYWAAYSNSARALAQEEQHVV